MSLLGSTINHIIRKTGYQIIRTPSPEAPALTYHQAIESCFQRRRHLRLVEVGANDGMINDPLYPIIMGDKRLKSNSCVLLIEPQKQLLPYLESNYSSHPNYRIENCAVGPAGNVVLHSIKESYWPYAQPPYAKGWPIYRAPTGITSTDPDHVAKWALEHITDLEDTDKALTTTEVACRPLTEILSEAKMPLEIDILQIDAEGNDDTVIYSSDLPLTQPSLIFFENVHTEAERRKKLSTYLTEQGYVELAHGGNTIALRIGSK